MLGEVASMTNYLESTGFSIALYHSWQWGAARNKKGVLKLRMIIVIIWWQWTFTEQWLKWWALFLSMFYMLVWGFPGGSKESTCQSRRCRFDPWVRKTPWRGKWQATPLFLPGKSHGRRSLAGYSPWGCSRVEHNVETKQQQYVLV